MDDLTVRLERIDEASRSAAMAPAWNMKSHIMVALVEFIGLLRVIVTRLLEIEKQIGEDHASGK